MKKIILFLALTIAVVACAQLIKLPPLSHVVAGNFTVHSIEILTNPETFYEGDMLSIGIRINFMRTIAGSNVYSFDLKETETKLMSLRLIGLKIGETHVNLLSYFGPTSEFPSDYQYGGFQIVGFRITKADLDAGYKDIWGWSTSYPLTCQEFTIHVDLDMEPVYGQPMAGYHIGTRKTWVCEKPFTSVHTKGKFVEKDAKAQQSFYRFVSISDVLVEPEPFQRGQPLKMKLLVNSEEVSGEYADMYMTYKIELVYESGKRRSVDHAYGHFSPDAAIRIISRPKSVGVPFLLLDRSGTIVYTLPEEITIPMFDLPGENAIAVEVTFCVYAILDVDRCTPYIFTKRWVARKIFVPEQ